MKKVIGLVVILAALLLGGYYGMGVLTEKNLKKNLTVLNKSDEISVEIENYKRGWFESNAVLSWELVVPAKVIEKNGKRIFTPSNKYYASMPLVIHHGPIIFQNQKLKFGLGYANSHIDLPKKYDEKFEELYSSGSIKPSLDLDVFVSYLADTSLNLTAPKFNLISNKDHTNFEWLGMTSYVDVSPNLDKIKGRVVIDGLTWIKSGTNSVLKKVESNYNLYRGDLGFYLGDASLHLPRAVVMKDDAKLIEVEQFNLKSRSSIDKDLFNSSFKATLGKLYIKNETYSSCSVDLNIRNLDASVLADMNKKISKTKHRSDSDRQRVLLSLLPDIPTLVNKGAEIEVTDFNIEMTDGRVRGNFLIALPRENNVNPFQLVQKVKGDGRIEVSADLLKSFIKHLYKNKYTVDTLKNNIAKPLPATENKSAESESTETTKSKAETAAKESIDEPANKSVDIEKQIADQADKKIADMLKRGLIKVNGSDYSIDFKVFEGRLTVNGNLFNPAMMQL
jgi:uncharacterized protein YdgA (DUF945 family)